MPAQLGDLLVCRDVEKADRGVATAGSESRAVGAESHSVENAHPAAPDLAEKAVFTQTPLLAENDRRRLVAGFVIDTAKRTNDRIAEFFLANNPGRFLGFATVPFQDPKAAAKELERAVKQLEFKRALINGYANIGNENTAQYLDEAPVHEFWERVDALGAPVYLHPRIPLPHQQHIYEGYEGLLGSAWGFGFETATHAIRLMLSGLFDRFPKLNVIVGHLGEGLPFTLPRVEHR